MSWRRTSRSRPTRTSRAAWPGRRARAAARRKLGNATHIREEIYDMNTISLVDSIWQDLQVRGPRAAAQSGVRAHGDNCRWRSASARTPRSSSSSTPCVSGRCPSPIPQDIVLVSLKDPDGARGSFDELAPGA